MRIFQQQVMAWTVRYNRHDLMTYWETGAEWRGQLSTATCWRQTKQGNDNMQLGTVKNWGLHPCGHAHSRLDLPPVNVVSHIPFKLDAQNLSCRKKKWICGVSAGDQSVQNTKNRVGAVDRDTPWCCLEKLSSLKSKNFWCHFNPKIYWHQSISYMYYTTVGHI